MDPRPPRLPISPGLSVAVRGCVRGWGTGIHHTFVVYFFLWEVGGGLQGQQMNLRVLEAVYVFISGYNDMAHKQKN